MGRVLFSFCLLFYEFDIHILFSVLVFDSYCLTTSSKFTRVKVFLIFLFSDADWFGEFYIRTYTRASPYIYGILFGYFMHNFSHVHRVTGRKIPKVARSSWSGRHPSHSSFMANYSQSELIEGIRAHTILDPILQRNFSVNLGIPMGCFKS